MKKVTEILFLFQLFSFPHVLIVKILKRV